jgi:hypothetical protein
MKRTAYFFILAALLLGTIACSITIDLTPTPLAPTQAVMATTIPTSVTMQNITVYFTNEARFAVGTEPYEDPVMRQVLATLDPMRAVLNQFFLGPTPEEYNAGLRLVNSGFTQVRDFSVENGIARVYLGGVCANNGAAYSVANLVKKNLSQFPQISAVKIFDENNSNLDPDSPNSSLPYCLEPVGSNVLPG